MLACKRSSEEGEQKGLNAENCVENTEQERREALNAKSEALGFLLHLLDSSNEVRASDKEDVLNLCGSGGAQFGGLLGLLPACHALGHQRPNRVASG